MNCSDVGEFGVRQGRLREQLKHKRQLARILRAGREESIDRGRSIPLGIRNIWLSHVDPTRSTIPPPLIGEFPVKLHAARSSCGDYCPRSTPAVRAITIATQSSVTPLTQGRSRRACHLLPRSTRAREFSRNNLAKRGDAHEQRPVRKANSKGEKERRRHGNRSGKALITSGYGRRRTNESRTQVREIEERPQPETRKLELSAQVPQMLEGQNI